MKLQFENSQGLTDEQIEHIEKIIGIQLPSNVRSFYKEHAGARPTINGKAPCIKIVLDNGWTTSSFLESIDSYKTLKSQLLDTSYLNEHAKYFNLSNEYVEPEFLFPIAVLPNGAVYIAISGKHNGKVYTADSGDFGIVFHSDSFEQFFASTFEC